MNSEKLINVVFKNLEYAGFLNLGTWNTSILDFLKKRNWECITIDSISPNDLKSLFDSRYPTIFHFSFIESRFADSLISYINESTLRPGWQKRFILLEFESITTEQEEKLKSSFYDKVPGAGNFYIHTFYTHYLQRK